MNLIGSKFAFRQSSQFIRKLILYLLTFVSIATYGQGAEERVLYVIDSVAIIDDPGEDEGVLTPYSLHRIFNLVV